MEANEKPAKVTDHRGHEIGITTTGKFTIDGEVHFYDTLAKTMEYVDRMIVEEAKETTKALAIPAIRFDGERGIVTGINRTSRDPIVKNMKRATIRSILSAEVYFDHPWVRETLQEYAETTKRLALLNKRLNSVIIRGTGPRRIEPEEYPNLIKELLQREDETREGPPAEAEE